MFDGFSPKLFYFAQIIPTFSEADVGGGSLLTFLHTIYSVSEWVMGEGEKAAHSASFY